MVRAGLDPDDEFCWLEIASARARVFPSCLLRAHAWMVSTQLWSSRGTKQKHVGQMALGSVVVFEVALSVVVLVMLGSAIKVALGAFVLYWAVSVWLWKRLFSRRASAGANTLIPGAPPLPPPATTEDEGAAAGAFTLLTFNFFQRSPGSPGGADGYGSEEYKDQRVTEFCRQLRANYADLDILCCQVHRQPPPPAGSTTFHVCLYRARFGWRVTHVGGARLPDRRSSFPSGSGGRSVCSPPHARSVSSITCTPRT